MRRSISSTFYVQLLRKQIPNAQKRQSSQHCLFTLLGSGSVKVERRTLVKLTPVERCYWCRLVPNNRRRSWRMRMSPLLVGTITATCSQFHYHFLISFCVNIIVLKNYKAKLLLKKSCAKHFHKKGESKMLMKLIQFHQCSTISFCTHRSQKSKKTLMT